MNRIRIALLITAVAAVAGYCIIQGTILLEATNRPFAAPHPNVRSCARESLTIKEGETDAAMGGVRRTPFVIKNDSSSACTLEGYPALELLNRAGAVVKRATKQKTDDPVTPVTLEPGKTAWFALNHNAGGAGYMGKPCPTYTRVRISIPTVTRPFTLRSDIQTCAKTDFEVTAISAGAPE
jgi:hypothetical protein